MILYLDLETFSDVPLEHGVHRYAERAEVLLTAWAIDDGEPHVAKGWPAGLMKGFLHQADTIVIHNSHFDRTVLRHAEGVELPVSKIWDTMAQARSCGLPGGLGRLSEILGLSAEEGKDKEGKALIQLFCKPRPKNMVLRRATKETHPEEWARFVAYAGKDIAAMRAAYKKLPKHNYRLPSERALWEADQAINDRGFAVDLDLAQAVIDAVGDEKARLAARCADLTDGEVARATQRDKLLAHLLAAYDVRLPDMTSGTLERRIQDETLPDPARELLAIRLQASGTSTGKYARLVNGANSDGRLRGTLEWNGAARTGRWAGRLFQPQNLPRTPKWFNAAAQAETVEAFKLGCADLVFGDDLMERASYAIRGSIIAPEGKKLVIADLSNIEGRVLAWLAGETWKLEAFERFDRGEGPDLYKVTAGNVLGKPVEDVTDDERQDQGKVPELACGYQGAVGAFDSMARLYGLELPEETILRIVKGWRRANPNIVSFWYELQDAAFTATRNPGVMVTCRKLKLRRDGAWLAIGLPSGRSLLYAHPRITPGRTCPECEGARTVKEAVWEGEEIVAWETQKCPACRGHGKLPEVLTYRGIDPYTRQWTDIATYGGKLVENVTQAVARDVMASAILRIEHGNMPAEVLLTVHDEIIAEAPDDDGFTAADLAGVMATNPPWAEGLPLAASGFETKRYRK